MKKTGLIGLGIISEHILYGLSYSKFNYSNYEYILKENELEISLDIENISDRDAEEVIQVYVGKKDSNIYRPIKELKAFEKIKVDKNLI